VPCPAWTLRAVGELNLSCELARSVRTSVRLKRVQSLSIDPAGDERRGDGVVMVRWSAMGQARCLETAKRPLVREFASHRHKTRCDQDQSFIARVQVIEAGRTTDR